MEEYIESIECKITFRDLTNARHEYEYLLRHFGDEEGEDKFFFIVPNAQPGEIRDVIAYDGNTGDQPSISRIPLNKGTKLLFSNLSPVANGQPKLLKFSYDAPTSAFRHEGLISNVAFYRAELFHTYDVGTAIVEVVLPKGSRILKYVGNMKKFEGTTITFEEHHLKRDTLYTFPIFFHRRKALATLAAALGAASLGAFADETMSKLLELVSDLFR